MTTLGLVRRDPGFDEAFVALYPRAVVLADRIIGNHAVAEDVAAEAMTRALLHWKKVRDLEWRDGWVLRTTSNLALDVVRRKRVEPDRERTVDPSEAATLRVALGAALAKLPRRQREAVALRYLSDLSEADVAAALQCAPGTVKSHLHRGLAALRLSLGDDVKEINDGIA